MAYAIDFKPAALRDLKRLPKDVQQRISNTIGSLADNPRPHGVKMRFASATAARPIGSGAPSEFPGEHRGIKRDATG